MKPRIIEAVFYEKDKLLTYEEAKDKALLFVEYIKTTNEDLSDYWYGIADNWDVNIWMNDDSNNIQASLYEVENGNTTDNFYPLDLGGL